MARRIIQAGNSLAVTLPSDALERLDLGLGSEVEVQVDEKDQSIRISATGPKVEIDPDFDARLRAFIERYRPALESLAQR